MKRREFIQRLALAGIGSGLMLHGCRPHPKPPIRSFPSNASIGHLLRNKPPLPSSYDEQETDVLIIGSGMAGLSCAYHLEKQAYAGNITLLEMQPYAGGNSFGGENLVSGFPWAAHYVPIPGLHLNELIAFFEELKIITHWQDQLPVYNEEYICFEQHERLFIHGVWQQGLIPDHGIPSSDKQVIKRFVKFVHQLRFEKDAQGNYLFDIPLHRSSKLTEHLALTSIKAEDWLKEQGFHSEYLHWYLDYCCADDFGGGLKNTSAWALLHYFASRKGKAFNAEHDDNLTWPEGNYFLVKKFCERIKSPILLNEIALYIVPSKIGYDVYHLNTETKRFTKTSCMQLVLNTPIHVTRKLIPELDTEEHRNLFQSFPWIVANITLRKPKEKQGAELSWDNVQYGLKSLGYIHSSHQLLGSSSNKVVFTCYKSFYETSATEERRKLETKSEEQLADELIDELRIIYPNLQEQIETIIVRKIGHGMITPLPGLLFSDTLQKLQQARGKLHLCHTDICGISIFEEAFYRGLETAKTIHHG